MADAQPVQLVLDFDSTIVSLEGLDELARIALADDADRDAILALPAVKAHTVALPATADYLHRHHDVPVANAFDAATLAPGAYWVIASHDPGFGAQDNVVHATLVWVTRLALVSQHAPGAPAGRSLAGHVVDGTTGEPVAGAMVTAFVREEGGHAAAFREGRSEIGRAHV